MPLRVAMLVGLFTLSTALNAQPDQAALSDVLDRLCAYLKSYAERLPATVARERYIQKAASHQRIELESDFGIVRLPGYPQWLGFRDVLRVNSRPVSDRELRLAALFSRPPSNAYQHAVRIAAASARFNVGPHGPSTILRSCSSFCGSVIV